MTFRPTTIERAYQLAESGSCRTVGDVKQQLNAEGFERVQESLYGSSVTAALRKLCQASYTGPDEEAGAAQADPDDDDD